jgi:hypothetical protein
MLWVMSGAPLDAGASTEAQAQAQAQTQTQTQDGGADTVPCKTVDDCWLDKDSNVIRRPKRYRGRALPHGDCGDNIRWLRNRLSCEENVCVAKFIGDKC